MNSRVRRRSPVGRYRDRSSSRERPRTRTYSDSDQHSESYQSDYSDDFEPDTKSAVRTPTRRRRGYEKRQNGYTSNAYSSTSELHSSSSKKTTQSLGRRTYVKPKRPKGWRSDVSDRGGRTGLRSDVIATRLLSAKQRRINDIQNDLSEAQQRLQDITKENRLLKTVQHRQDKALRHYQDVESDLPRLISQNHEEQKVLQTRLRKAKQAEKHLEEKLRENNDEMQKMEKTLRKLKKVVEDKNLGERSELARQLTNTENDLSYANRKVKELEKKLELMTSSYTRQIKTERQKHKETKEKFDELLEEHRAAITKLKEKERALGVSNIYSLRNKDSNSVKSTPRKAKDVPVSSRAPKERLRIEHKSSRTEMVQEYVDIDHDRESKQHRMEQRLPSPGPPSPAPFARSSVKPKDRENLEASHFESVGNQAASQEKRNVFLTSQASSPFTVQPAVKDSIDFSDKNEDESTEDRDTLGFSVPYRSFDDTKPEDDPLTEVAKQRKKDEAIKKKQLEEEELKRQQKLRAEQEEFAEKQKKKAALLAKMRDIEQEDESPRSPPSSVPVVSLGDTSKPEQPIHKKESKRASDSSHENNQKSNAERVRSLFGNDTDPIVENLHLGLPTTTAKSDSNLSFGSYAPSVGRGEQVQKPRVAKKKSVLSSEESENDEPLFDISSGKQAKNSDLLSQLFGDQPKSDKTSTTLEQKGGDPVITPRAKPVHSGYPWEKNVVTSTRGNGAATQNYKVKTGFQVKGSTPVQDDDIEELSL